MYLFLSVILIMARILALNLIGSGNLECPDYWRNVSSARSRGRWLSEPHKTVTELIRTYETSGINDSKWLVTLRATLRATVPHRWDTFRVKPGQMFHRGSPAFAILGSCQSRRVRLVGPSVSRCFLGALCLPLDLGLGFRVR